jgi:predicted nucleic acid-binding protein
MSKQVVRALLDTNALLYLINPKSVHNKALIELLKSCDNHDLSLYVAAHSLKDFYYIASKAPYLLDDKVKRKCLDFFLKTFKHINLTEEIQRSALVDNGPDFEDAIVKISAESCMCNFVVTYDMSKRAFESEVFKKVTAEELVVLLAQKKS